MTGARGLRRLAPLALTARAAAARLATCRADGRPGPHESEPWRRVSLRWRRLRRPTPDRVVVRTVTTTHHHWSRHTHLLPTATTSVSARSGAPALASKLVVSTERRFLIDRRPNVSSADGGPPLTAAVERRARLSPASTSAAAHLRLQAAPIRAAAWRLRSTEPAPPPGHHSGPRPGARPYGSLRVSRDGVGPASPTPRRSATRRELTLLLPRVLAPATRAAAAADEPDALPARPARPADMSWRRPARAASEPGGQEVRSFPPAALRPAPRSPAAPEAFPGPQTPTGHAAPARAAHVLDSVVLDRLADDVIRRVDRRARIDRERRGL